MLRAMISMWSFLNVARRHQGPQRVSIPRVVDILFERSSNIPVRRNWKESSCRGSNVGVLESERQVEFDHWKQVISCRSRSAVRSNLPICSRFQACGLEGVELRSVGRRFCIGLKVGLMPKSYILSCLLRKPDGGTMGHQRWSEFTFVIN